MSNGYVFPQDQPEGAAGKARAGGLTLRQYYAGQALEGALSSGTHSLWNPETLAKLVAGIADAMVKELG